MNVKHPDLQLRDTAERRRYCFIHFTKMILLNDGVTLLLAIAELCVYSIQQFDLKRFVGEADLQFLHRILNPADTCPGWKSQNSYHNCEGPIG